MGLRLYVSCIKLYKKEEEKVMLNLLDGSIGSSGWNKAQTVCVDTNLVKAAAQSQRCTYIHTYIQKAVPSKGSQDKVCLFSWSSQTGYMTCSVFTCLTFNLQEQSKPGVLEGRAPLENSTGQTAALPSPRRLRSPVAFDTVCSTNWWWWQVEGAVQAFREQPVQNWAWQRLPEVAWNLLITGDISQIWSSS